ncbi:cytochrome c oxidase assembly protein subunit 11 [Andreprevotia lacus DSM 23236]|jgi:cytochrome c oxidase assembly protein subunit 11|uniref:Cytochrome c oxidase assembly protein CtaG n=1 Tax=Andreprevotia lacus DSM 23236 TaxID=1121001 RepID=A0A1W1XZ75_9NEIS|nr:cytochrome c oxidase assembly protein [Andreprevotia lacus]SMC29174.1 cytochrome c oxidase assembly protein subunit 11 [Andreprevotia lacus DSM 23236]
MSTLAQQPAGRPDRSGANKRLALKLGLAAALMFGFGYAMAPMYGRFCQFLGLDRARPELADVNAAALRLEFDTNVADGLPLTVEALEPIVAARPGKLVKAKFRVTNTSDQSMVIRAVPSFAPPRSAGYLSKLECFCFNAMTMAPNEAREVTVVLAVAAKLPDELGAATLSYTFHRLEGEMAKTGGNPT